MLSVFMIMTIYILSILGFIIVPAVIINHHEEQIDKQIDNNEQIDKQIDNNEEIKTLLTILMLFYF